MCINATDVCHMVSLLMKDINLYSTEELLDEIQDRFDSCIFYGLQDRTNERSVYNRRYKGNLATCLGLCTFLSNVLQDEYFHIVELKDDGE